MLLVKKWLNGSQNFIVGKVLYKHFSKDNSLSELLSSGETSFAKTALLQALRELHDKGSKKTIQPKDAPIAQMPDGTDKILQAIHYEWNPLYQEMNLLRHKLDLYGNDNSQTSRATRRSIGENILSLEQQINAIWNKRDYYLQHGKLPETKEEEFIMPTDPYELAKLMTRVKRYVNRHKKNLKDNPGNATYAALLDKYETQLKQINSITKNETNKFQHVP